MTDKQKQQKYKIYCTQFDKAKCPNCNTKLDVKVEEKHDNKDDLISVVDLYCSQCHYSTQIARLYKDCIR